MNNDRIRELLDAYGADPRRWPAREQAVFAEFFDPGGEAARWLAEARALDAVFDRYEVPALDVTTRVMAALPRPPLERFLSWLLPTDPRHAWRPALAATLPLALGVAIGLADPQATAGDETWAIEERDLLLSPLEGRLEVSWYE